MGLTKVARLFCNKLAIEVGFSMPLDLFWRCQNENGGIVAVMLSAYIVKWAEIGKQLWEEFNFQALCFSCKIGLFFEDVTCGDSLNQ